MSAYVHDLDFALGCSSSAVEHVRRLLGEGYRTEVKPDHTPVTTIDQAVNQRFIEQVTQRFPTDGVLGEEASSTGTGSRTWVIDPIDGTAQLLQGVPLFMVSIALVVDGRPVVGVAANPSTRQTYWASSGSGAYRDGTRLHVSQRDGTGEALTVGGSNNRAQLAGLDHDGLARLTLGPRPHVTAARFPFPSAFSGCKVAEGSWDAELFGQTAAHDVAATCVLVREAGGTVTDRNGRDQRYDRPVNGCVLTNGVIHDAVLDCWRSETR